MSEAAKWYQYMLAESAAVKQAQLQALAGQFYGAMQASSATNNFTTMLQNISSTTVSVPGAQWGVAAQPQQKKWEAEETYGEAIVGWRVWDVESQRGEHMTVAQLATHMKAGGSWEELLLPVLKSVGVFAHWEPRKKVKAICTTNSQHHGPEGAPVWGCACGWWAFKTQEEMVRRRGMSSEVIGSVYLWDRVIETESGYRSRYAYPKELWIDGNEELAEQLSSNYGVPVHTNREELLLAERERQAREMTEYKQQWLTAETQIDFSSPLTPFTLTWDDDTTDTPGEGQQGQVSGQGYLRRMLGK